MDIRFDEFLEESARIHGHLCAGQVLGVRMALLGLRMIGISDPKGAERKQLIVFVEMDRCAADAIQSVTGCSLGKRSLKFLDYGKMAATFLNLRTATAVRVLAREESRGQAKALFPDEADVHAGQREAYKVLPDEDLFEVTSVAVPLSPEDMPGRPLRRVRCDACGEHVQDMREVRSNGRVLCVPCSRGCYYTVLSQEPLTTGMADPSRAPLASEARIATSRGPHPSGERTTPARAPLPSGERTTPTHAPLPSGERTTPTHAPLPSGERTKVRGGFSR